MKTLTKKTRYVLLAFTTAFLFFALELAVFAGLYFTTTYFFAQLVLATGLFAMVVGGFLAASVSKERIDLWLTRAVMSYFLLPLIALMAVLVSLAYSAVAVIMLVATFSPIGFVLAVLYRRVDARILYASELFGAVAGLGAALFLLPMVREENFLFVLSALGAGVGMVWLRKTERTPRHLVFAALLVLIAVFTMSNVQHNTVNLATDALCSLERQQELGIRKVMCLDESGVAYQVVRSLGSIVDRIDIVSPIGGGRSLSVIFSGTQNDILRPYPEEFYKYDARIPGGIIDSPDTLIIGTSVEGVVKNARAIGSRSVTALEFNQAIIDVWELDDELQDFAFLPHEEVKLTKKDGRSYLEQSETSFDIITLMNTRRVRDAAQFGQPDFLHTKEAFSAMLDRLTENGFITIEEPNFSQQSADSTARIVASLRAALRDRGIVDFGKYIIAYEWVGIERGQVISVRPPLVYTQFLVKRTPWTEDELSAFNRWTVASVDPAHHRMDASNITFYQLLWSPDSGLADGAEESNIARAIEGTFDAKIIVDTHPYTTTASTIQTKLLWWLSSLFLIMFVAAMFVLRRKKKQHIGYAPWLAYFACIGLGYMFIEIFLLYWMQFYLGSIPLALAVSIGGLFVAGGATSLALQYSGWNIHRYFAVLLIAAICVLAVMFLKPFLGAGFYVRVSVAVVGCGLVGAFLAPFFPFGIRAAEEKLHENVPFFVGVNGAALALGVPIALVFGASYGFLPLVALAVLMYAIAIVVFSVVCYST